MMAAVSLVAGILTLWKEEVLVDYTIEVEDEQFRVHKVIMASVSDYFKVMLTGDMMESQTDRVRLHELSSLVVSNMLEFIYTGQFASNDATTEDLLACAVYLQISAAIDECTKLLLSKVNKQNCFDILATFKTYSVRVGVLKVTQYIKSHIADLMQASPPDMASKGFQCFMEFWQKSEWELYVSILELIAADDDRRQYMDDILSRVRFALMTPNQLEAVKHCDVYTDFDGTWRDHVDIAEVFHKLPTHQKVLDRSEQSKARGDPVPVCFTADNTSSSVLYSLHDGKSWKKYQAQLAPSLCEGVAALVTVNNYLIVCDSYFSWEENDTFFQGWHIFDPRTLVWSTMAPMNEARDSFALVHHKKYLYALGGCIELCPEVRALTDIVERFNFESNSWEVIPTKLPVALENHGACVIGDCLYVAGGYSRNQFSKKLACLDMNTNTWQNKAPMTIGKGSSTVDVIQVMKLWDEEVLFIFDRMFAMHFYSPSTNQWSVWKCLSDVDSDIVHSHSPHVLVDDNTLFLHSFAYTMKANRTDNSYRNKSVNAHDERKGCVKWTLGEKGEKVIEDKLNDFPVDVNVKGDWAFLSDLLSIAPQYLGRPKKISTS